MSSRLTEKLRVGPQVYDRNLGKLGRWHPSLDWAVVDYRFTNWLGMPGGKVKTSFGLHNDSQDLDFPADRSISGKQNKKTQFFVADFSWLTLRLSS